MTTTQPATAPATTPPAAAPRPASAADRLPVRATAVAVAADVLLMGVIGQLLPPPAAFAVLSVAVLVGLARRPGRRTPVLALIALVALAGGAPFWSADLRHPADTIAFVWATLSAGGRMTVVLAAVLARRGVAADGPARRLGVATLGVVALALVTTMVARTSIPQEAAQPGDVEVVVRDVAFPSRTTVASGDTVHVDTRDPIRHTWTAEGTDLDVPLGPTAARRVAVGLPPGEYALICVVPGHESMRGVLEVTA